MHKDKLLLYMNSICQIN